LEQPKAVCYTHYLLFFADGGNFDVSLSLASFSLCTLQSFELQSCFQMFFIILFLIAQLTSDEPPDDQLYLF